VPDFLDSRTPVPKISISMRITPCICPKSQSSIDVYENCLNIQNPLIFPLSLCIWVFSFCQIHRINKRVFYLTAGCIHLNNDHLFLLSEMNSFIKTWPIRVLEDCGITVSIIYSADTCCLMQFPVTQFQTAITKI